MGIPRILTVSLFRLTHCIRQSAINTPFRAPIPAISHFHLFRFRPEIFGKLLENLQLYYIYLVFNKESVVIGICSIMFKYS